MRRAERQHALLDVLRANAERPVSVRLLAERFDVSTRTVERDVRSLQEAGVPVYGVAGRTGGYAISRDYSLPPLALSPHESLAVLAGLAVMTGSPFAPDAATAAEKIVASLPAEHRPRARWLASRVAALTPEGATRADVADVVRRAVLDPRVVELDYVAHDTGERSRRAVEPLGLICVRGSWILVGWCRLRHAVRGFRTDLITEVRQTDEVPPLRHPDPLAADLGRWDFLAPPV